MDLVYAHILQAYMGNFSYEVNKLYNCKYPGILVKITGKEREIFNLYNMINSWTTERQLETQTLVTSLAFFNNSMINFAHVVCGDRGKSGLEYGQLTSSFDSWTWFALGLTVIIHYPVLKGVLSTSSTKLDWISVYKVLLEQGSPFANPITSFPLRLAVCLYLLVGVVITNSYKNVNVYKMTQLRPRVRYETIQQLQEDKYNWYTRVRGIQYAGLENNFSSTKMSIHNATWKVTTYLPNFYVIFVESWISIIAYPEISLNLELILGDTPDELTLVKRLAQTHPLSTSEHIRLITELISRNSSGMLYEEDILQLYQKIEENLLLDSLRQCNKTVLFLPENIGTQYRKTVERQQPDINVDILNPHSQRVLVSLTFHGPSSSQAAYRALAMHQSGIVRWWEKVVFRTDLKGRTHHTKPIAASLSGNISILFLPLVFGSLVAFGIFTCEKLLSASQLNDS